MFDFVAVDLKNV